MLRCISVSVKMTILIPMFALIGSVNAQLKPDIHWLTITTPHFDVVTPEAALKKGQETAHLLEYLYPSFGATLNSSMQRWTVKINNQVATPNGFVTLAPRYSEFYLTQESMFMPNTFYDDEFIHLLAVHETRHMAQMSKLTVGFNRFRYFLGGENLLLIMQILTVPGWYFEGDAVNFETLYSTGGRGRCPSFVQMTKARILAQKPLGYYQSLLGSYVKSDAGDPYLVGYPLVSFMKKQYGDDVFGRIMEKKNTFRGQLPGGFRFAVRRVTGKKLLKIYRTSNDSMKAAWKRQLDGLDTTNIKVLVPPKTNYEAGYFSPQWLDNRTIVYLSSRTDDVLSVEMVDLEGKQQKVQSNLIAYPWIASRCSSLVFAAPRKHPRFDNEYSEIYKYDLPAGKTTKLTDNTRLFTPALSPDGTRLAAFSIDSTGTCAIEIIAVSTGTTEKRKTIPVNDAPSSIVWDTDSRDIFYIDNTPDGYTVVRWLLATDSLRCVIPPQRNKMTCLEVYRNWLLYTSQLSGIDNIYAYDILTDQQYQVTSRSFGATYSTVSPDGRTIAVVDFGGVHGNSLAVVPFSPSEWKEIGAAQVRPVALYDTKVDSQPLFSYKQFLEQEKTDFSVRDYPRWKHHVNIHSWQSLVSPFFFADGTSLFGAAIQSQSIFSDWTWSVAAASTFPFDDQIMVAPKLVCNKYWPVFYLTPELIRYDAFFDAENKHYSAAGDFGMQVPFQISDAHTVQSLLLGVDVAPQATLDESLRRIRETTRLETGYFAAYKYVCNAPAISMSSYYGLSGFSRLRTTPYSVSPYYEENIVTTELDLALPGFVRKDNWLLQGAVQRSDAGQGGLYVPRGLPDTLYGGKKRFFGSINYMMPLLHPDFALGPLVYFTRIAASLFADASIDLEDSFTMNSLSKQPKSYSGGIELTTEFIPLSIVYLYGIVGVRYAVGKDAAGKTVSGPGLLFSLGVPGMAEIFKTVRSRTVEKAADRSSLATLNRHFRGPESSASLRSQRSFSKAAFPKSHRAF